MTYYIISISKKGILSRGDTFKERELLENKFGHIQPIEGLPWYLNELGLNETIYMAIRPDLHPLTCDEVEQFKKLFDKNNRTIQFFQLTKMLSGT